MAGLTFTDGLKLRGHFAAYELRPDGERVALYEDDNQIQYAGANLLARALAGLLDTMPTLSGIAMDAASSTTPAGAPRAKYASDPPFTYDSFAVGFTASPSTSTTASQTVVCRGVFAGYAGTDRHYEFALLMSDNNTSSPTDYALAYKYVEGGIGWGVGSQIEIVWTLYLGTS